VLIAISFAIGFLCGSIPFGQVFARLRGVDLRAVGSGNIGATNAARALGKGLGVATLVCDAAKGAVPILIAGRILSGRPELDWMLAAVGLGAVLGHMFCPWLKFRGGKGVATGLGVFAALAWLPAVIAAVAWIVVYAIWRVSSVGSLIATALLPIAIFFLGGVRPVFFLAIVLFPVIVWKHRANIGRLIRREESKV
jgi:glycerol-3-phosphate acyltransferase PlsY